MPRERVISQASTGQDEERSTNRSRPERLDDCIGPAAVIEQLRIALEATQKRSERWSSSARRPAGLGQNDIRTGHRRELGADVSRDHGPGHHQAGRLDALAHGMKRGDVRLSTKFTA